MKVKRIEMLTASGEFAESLICKTILREIEDAILAVKWPVGNKDFVLYPGTKAEKTHNGVVPIKRDCQLHLKANGWLLEYHGAFKSLRLGKIDAAKILQDGRIFVLEWETGNISSTHRALNKMYMGMLKGIISGGVLILPSREFYKYLTDRVGNYQEIEPYFDLFRSIPITDGVLTIFEIEYDRLSLDVPRIPLGTDGRALR